MIPVFPYDFPIFHPENLRVPTSRGPANKQKAIHAKAKPTNLRVRLIPRVWGGKTW